MKRHNGEGVLIMISQMAMAGSMKNSRGEKKGWKTNETMLVLAWRKLTTPLSSLSFPLRLLRRQPFASGLA